MPEPTMTAPAPRVRSRFDAIEDRIDAIEVAGKRDERLAYRSGEVAALIGVSKSCWHAYVSRGCCPPAISAPGEHVTLYGKATVEDWLRRSEAAGRLLSTREYRESVAMDDGEPA